MTQKSFFCIKNKLKLRNWPNVLPPPPPVCISHENRTIVLLCLQQPIKNQNQKIKKYRKKINLDVTTAALSIKYQLNFFGGIKWPKLLNVTCLSICLLDNSRQILIKYRTYNEHHNVHESSLLKGNFRYIFS